MLEALLLLAIGLTAIVGVAVVAAVGEVFRRGVSLREDVDGGRYASPPCRPCAASCVANQVTCWLSTPDGRLAAHLAASMRSSASTWGTICHL